MLAIHDQFTRQMSDRLRTTGMGLWLVRLLQRAGRIEDARTTLISLENGFQGVAVESVEPSQKAAVSAQIIVTSGTGEYYLAEVGESLIGRDCIHCTGILS
jgi:hypothetical protein